MCTLMYNEGIAGYGGYCSESQSYNTFLLPLSSTQNELVQNSNFAIGVEEKAKRVYLIDFGLAKRYVYDSGELRSLRNKISFKGTSRYASANVLHGKDPGRRDDLISLFYTLVDLHAPKLPWKKISDHKELATMKESYDHSTLIAGFPSTFLQFFDHLKLLDTLEKPDYGLLLSTLETCLKERALNSFDVETDDIFQGTDYLSDHALSSQTLSSETITGEVTSLYDKDFEVNFHTFQIHSVLNPLLLCFHPNTTFEM
ncbi:Tau-tubulin kinase 1 [Araneus ventricosus]|uniref:Tau-tubulin kinase 1 n=1 Tax=Araneus ventricosus TaxID=182803 RepID=A0A4Y2N6W5_ARAVE|nr:Tau-tubulin kinase 1 [Araneus ventricosus]